MALVANKEDKNSTEKRDLLMQKFKISGFADEIDSSLEVQLKGLNELGISYIEPRGINGKNVAEHSVAEAKEVKNMFDDFNIKVSAIGSPIGKIKITDNFAPELDKFKHILEIADIFDTKYIRMFSFFMPENENPANFRDEVLERWTQYINAVKGCNITLLHENEKDIYGDTAARCKDLLDTLDCDYARLTFDPANFVQCGEDTLAAFDLLENYVEYLHIKDARIADGQVVPAGLGDGNVEEILRRLAAKSYDGFVSLEPHLANFDGFAELEGEGVSITNMEKSGFGTFKIAADALKNILSRI